MNLIIENMAAPRVLFLLLCWATLLAACLSTSLKGPTTPPNSPEPRVVLLGQLKSKGKVIGAVYAVGADIVVTYGSTPTPNATSWQSAICISGPCETTNIIQRVHTQLMDKSVYTWIQLRSYTSVSLGDLVMLKDRVLPKPVNPLVRVRIPPQSSDHRKGRIIVRLSTGNETCERQFGSFTLETQAPDTNLSSLVISNSTIKRVGSAICSNSSLFNLLPSTTSLSPTAATLTVGATSLSFTATTSTGTTTLSSTAAATTSPSPSATPHPVWNCSKLTSGYGVCWKQLRKLGHFVLCANDTGPREYMAFGWSRNVKKTTMVKADAVVCSHHINGTWDVEDYYLESRKPCGTNERGETVGVCPDTAFGGESNIGATSGSYENGVGYCAFKRWLYTSRKHDRKITVKKKQAIVWAIGPVDADGQIQKHSKRAGIMQFFSFVGGGQQCESSDPKLCCNNIIQE